MAKKLNHKMWWLTIIIGFIIAALVYLTWQQQLKKPVKPFKAQMTQKHTF